MMTVEENRDSLRSVADSLKKAHKEISKVADKMETWLTTEYELLGSREYGRVCQTLGVLDEQIAKTSNQLSKLI